MSHFGGGSGGGLTKGLSSVVFETDTVSTVLLGLLWTGIVLALGCFAARRTTLPRALALSGPRLRWNPVTSTLTGTAAVLCCSTLVIALLAGAAALTGRDQAAKAAGLLLLLGPNLIGVLLTAGLGTSWEAGVHRLQAEGGGMLEMLGGATRGDTAGTREHVDVGGWSSAGVPPVAGRHDPRAALPDDRRLRGSRPHPCSHATRGFRGTARPPRGDRPAHGHRSEPGGPAAPPLTRGAARVGISVMGNEMGGMTVGLDGSTGLSALIGFVLAALGSYAGSRLHGRRPGVRA
ncbi:streptophobe family protein [Streptomyces cinereoruber]|uniref:streptophobe family protein n=1 Tax=Streptomyces cinereoruber TaxID=67260 RepID=UPI00362D485C